MQSKPADFRQILQFTCDHELSKLNVVTIKVMIYCCVAYLHLFVHCVVCWTGTVKYWLAVQPGCYPANSAQCAGVIWFGCGLCFLFSRFLGEGVKWLLKIWDQRLQSVSEMVGFTPGEKELSHQSHIFAGAVSGVATRIITQPLDVLKIRFQVCSG